MMLGDLIHLVMYLVLYGVMASAAISDWRTRHASDAHWIVACVVCIPLMSVHLCSSMGPIVAICHLCGTVPLSLHALSGRVVGWYSVLAVMVGSVTMTIPYVCGIPGAQALLTVPMVVIASTLLYRSGMRIGGADVKCIMVLSMILPTYPVPVPMGSLVGVGTIPVLSIVLSASVLTMGVTLVSVYRNVRDRTLSWRALSTYVVGRDDHDPVREVIVDDMGDRVRVTPLVPFLVPLAVSTVFTTAIGDPVAHLMMFMG